MTTQEAMADFPKTPRTPTSKNGKPTPEKILEFFEHNPMIHVTATELAGFLGERWTTQIRMALADLIHQNRLSAFWEVTEQGPCRKYHRSGALPQTASAHA